MNQNQELVSFPFKPYLAKFLFYLSENRIIEGDDAYYRNLDLNMKNPDSRFIRVLMTRKNIPGIKQMESKGFRFTVRIPKKSTQYNSVIEDSRTKAIWIDEETARIIHDHFDSKFRDHFCSFVAGAVHGSGNKRKAIKKAILFFMDKYDLHKDSVEYNYDQLIKLYRRRNIPVKQPIYATKSQESKQKPAEALQNAVNQIDKILPD